jgi:surfeit locus 1 family protein
MTRAEPRPGFPIGLTIGTVMVLVLLLTLGVWQVQRLQWKEGLIDQAAATQDMPPVPLATLIGAGDAAEFRRINVDCPGLASAPYVELQSIQDGAAGVRLISACSVTPSQGGAPVTYLVDRGFVDQAISARPAVQPSDDPVALTAVLRSAPQPTILSPAPVAGRFYARDTVAMAQALGVDPAGVAAPTLFAITSSNPDWDALQPSSPPVAFSNNHLGYAITWFGLALALVGFYVAILRRRMRG